MINEGFLFSLPLNDKKVGRLLPWNKRYRFSPIAETAKKWIILSYFDAHLWRKSESPGFILEMKLNRFSLYKHYFFNAHLWRANIQPLFLAAGLASFFRCPPMKGGSFSPFLLRSNNRILIHRERDLAYYPPKLMQIWKRSYIFSGFKLPQPYSFPSQKVVGKGGGGACNKVHKLFMQQITEALIGVLPN